MVSGADLFALANGTIAFGGFTPTPPGPTMGSPQKAADLPNPALPDPGVPNTFVSRS